MKTYLRFSSIFVAILLSGCLQVSHTEQRVVELPPADPNSTLDTAAKIGQGLFAGTMGADIQKQFGLTPQQMQSVFLTWNVGNFQGKRSVFFLTGIRYSGSLPQAKAIADYCESRVKQAVSETFQRTQSTTNSLSPTSRSPASQP
jgi:hypothetical protein